MSPAKADHGRFQAENYPVFVGLLPDWAVFSECGIDTPEGVKVPDVAAMPRKRSRLYRGRASLPEAQRFAWKSFPSSTVRPRWQ